MIHKWEVTIPELTGEERRRAYLYLPDAYEREPDQRYPVLYMFDGHNVFFDEDATYGKSWGLGEYLDYTGAPLIVAAVATRITAAFPSIPPSPSTSRTWGRSPAGGTSPWNGW